MMRKPDRSLYFHSARGSQYSRQAVLKPLRVIEANLSMSGVGNCYDNAKAEAFFSPLKTECFPPNQLFSSKALARRARSASVKNSSESDMRWKLLVGISRRSRVSAYPGSLLTADRHRS